MGEITMEYKISVIVPAYNCEKTLPETLDSLLGQTVHNETQIIAVNDGSTDGTAEIIKSYAAKYDNVVFCDKENGGVSDARNVGLKAASGKYVIFLDADDLLTPSSCEQAYIALEKTGAECGVFRLSRFGFGGEQYNPVTEEITSNETLEYNDKRLIWTFLIGNKCFLRQAVIDSGVLFPPTAYCEDGVFWMSFLMKRRCKVAGVRLAECRYRRLDPSEGRSVTQTMKISLVRDFFTSSEMILSSLESEELKTEMKVKICRTVTNEFYRRLWQTDDEILALLKSGYEKYYSELPPELKGRVLSLDPDIGEPVFSKQLAAKSPKVTVKAKAPSAEFLSSLYSQTMPLFELVTPDAGEYEKCENAVKTASGAPVTLKFSGKRPLKPGFLRIVVLLKGKKPFSFLPDFILKQAALIYTKAKG